MPQTATLSRLETQSPLDLWHLLSLDAPTVATLWLIFVAHATHTAIPPRFPAVMFLAVWLIYAADRILEQDDFEPRHRFHQDHAKAFLTTMAGAAIALSLLLARIHLPSAYFVVAAAFLAWFAAVHLTPLRLPKEPATGLFFAAAIFAPEFPKAWPEALAFALLCTLNCAWINRWESSAPGRYVPQLTAALVLILLHPTPITAAIALAAAALLTLNHYRARFHPTTLRAAADLALLTPILFLAR